MGEKISKMMSEFGALRKSQEAQKKTDQNNSQTECVIVEDKKKTTINSSIQGGGGSTIEHDLENEINQFDLEEKKKKKVIELDDEFDMPDLDSKQKTPLVGTINTTKPATNIAVIGTGVKPTTIISGDYKNSIYTSQPIVDKKVDPIITKKPDPIINQDPIGTTTKTTTDPISTTTTKDPIISKNNTIPKVNESVKINGQA